ncbi:hypothetical protein [Pseudoclavibacter sp. 8L]|uniref:hypothetical protein n=1 Tax=Pseudoclavibacter sp. 8L TaxID=2653162 RepID=UPI001359B3A5|nr:hypothetical protein [Pseudoclavibacter sp. 8L]
MDFINLHGTAAGWIGAVGTLAEVFGAIGTVAAFGIAAAGYFWSVRRAREAQARRVYAHVDDLVCHREREFVDTGQFIRGGESDTAYSEHLSWEPGEDRHGNSIRHYSTPIVACHVKLSNGSDEIMGPIRVDLVDPISGSLVRDGSSEVRRLEPLGSLIRVMVIEDEWSGRPPLKARIVFRDSSGTWWHRYESEPIQRAPRSIRGGASAEQVFARKLRSRG